MTTPVTANEAQVRVHDVMLLGPVLGRVVGMLAARASCPVDRLDDALLLTDAIAAHAPAHAADGPVEVTVRTDDAGLELVVEALADDGPQRLLDDAVLPQVGNVFEKVADEVATDAGRLRIRLNFQAATA